LRRASGTCTLDDMETGKTIEERLAPYTSGRRRRLHRSVFTRSGTPLRARIDAQIDALAGRFELDRLLFDLEVEAQGRWLANLEAFDAFAARRRTGGEPA
jgi:hypothetical protein